MKKLIVLAVLLIACSPPIALLSTYTVEERVSYVKEALLGASETPLTLLISKPGVYELEEGVLEIRNLGEEHVSVFVHSGAGETILVVGPGNGTAISLESPPYALKANSTCRLHLALWGVRRTRPLLPLSILALALPVAGVTLAAYYLASLRAEAGLERAHSRCVRVFTKSDLH